MKPILLRPAAFSLALATVAFFSTSARSDEWTYFFPEYVTQISYKVEPYMVAPAPDAAPSAFFVCQARAIRVGREKAGEREEFSYEVSRRPLTNRGRHQAVAACEKWMTEATKRRDRAHGLRK